MVGFFLSKEPSLPVIGNIELVPVKDQMFACKASLKDQGYCLMLDTGAICSLSLPSDIIKSCDLKKIKTTNWLDINGNKYTSPLYEVPSIQLGNYSFLSILAKQQDSFFEKQGCRIPYKKAEKQQEFQSRRVVVPTGSIGINLLRKNPYWIIDLKNLKLCLISDLKKALNLPELTSKKRQRVSLDPKQKHLVISLRTDFGVKKFIVDTGAELSLIKTISSSNYLRTNLVTLEGENLGEIELLNFKFPSGKGFESVDGILGLDFLKKHALLVDFEKNELWVLE